MKLTAALACLCAAALGAAGGASARDVRAAGPVRALATTGVEVAYAAEVRPRCFELRVWDTSDRGVRRYGSHCFLSTSTGSGVAAVAVSNRRALWLTYTGGNIREWSLWTRTRTSRATRIRFTTADVDGPAPIVVGSAWEGSLPYAAGRTVVVLHPNGSRRFAVDAPDRVVSLSAHTRGFAAVLADGRVLTLTREGRPVREHAFAPGEVQAAVLAGPGLIAFTRSGVEVRNGASVRRIPLPVGSRFRGFSEGVLAYAVGTDLRLLRLRDGRSVAFRTLAGTYAQLGRRGVGHASGRRVTFEAWAVVAAAAAAANR